MSEASRRVLSPVERLSEILFGLIMALTFTGSLSAATAAREEVRTMLIGALGCNIAWGLVDAVMYIMAAVTERSRNLRTLRAVRAAAAADQAREVIRDALPPALGDVVEADTLDRLRAGLMTLPEPPARPWVSGADLKGAFAVFLLVVLATIPVVIPFLFLTETRTALRVSNGVALVMLFACGYSLARYAGLRPVRTGLAMLGVGTVLVLITIALGG